MGNRKYLLIKAWGWGFWSDMDHLTGQLLVAELTNRIPVVYWGTNSLYSEYLGTNAFELYYEPVSPYSIYDVARPGHSFFPSFWNYKNVLVEDLDKTARLNRNLGDLMGTKADVAVSDVHFYSRPIMHYIPKNHWAYGMTGVQIYRCLIRKYLRLKPDIQNEINTFYDTKLRDERPVLGVHIRGSDKVREVENLAQMNRRYQKEIDRVVRTYDIKRIFMITDCQEMIDFYTKLYGSMLVYTDCRRATKNAVEKAVHLENYTDKRRKGIEVILDTYLASKCDFFIGNGYSNVSFTVNRLKDWPKGTITLFYRTLRKDQKIGHRRARAEIATKRYRLKKHKQEYPELYGGV